MKNYLDLPGKCHEARHGVCEPTPTLFLISGGANPTIVYEYGSHPAVAATVSHLSTYHSISHSWSLSPSTSQPRPFAFIDKLRTIDCPQSDRVATSSLLLQESNGISDAFQPVPQLNKSITKLMNADHFLLLPHVRVETSCQFADISEPYITHTHFIRLHLCENPHTTTHLNFPSSQWINALLQAVENGL